MCSSHFSAVSVRRGSMHTSFARRRAWPPARWRQKCRLLRDRVAAPDQDQLRLGEELDLHADLAAQSVASGLAAGRRADGAVQQRGAELVEKAPVHRSRPAPGPWCRRSCRAGWPAGRARRWLAAAPRCRPAPRPRSPARTGPRPWGRRAAAAAAGARGGRCARCSARPWCTARRPCAGAPGLPCSLTRHAVLHGGDQRAGVGAVVRAGALDLHRTFRRIGARENADGFAHAVTL